jgi:hypothetical protein
MLSKDKEKQRAVEGSRGKKGSLEESCRRSRSRSTEEEEVGRRRRGQEAETMEVKVQATHVYVCHTLSRASYNFSHV